MKILHQTIAYALITSALCLLSACDTHTANYEVKRYTCTFEGAYWNALVDSNPNGDNLLNGEIDTEWQDEQSGLAGSITQPYTGYWEGLALSNHCNKNPELEDIHKMQLYAYVDAAYSGNNFLICNGFMSGCVELRFERGSSFIESMRVANTTYSRNVTGSGYRMADRPLGKNESIWIEAEGYINGSEEIQATSKFYLYEDGEPAFEGWEKWYMTSMCKVDRILFHIRWNGSEPYNPYPAYFAVDDVVVVQHEYK